ncbi:MAG: AAA family ATPase [Oscillospiraceae bacterium]
MKIKLAVLDQDKNYLNRIASVFMSKFADKIEFYSFSDQEVAISSLATTKIDVLLSSTAFSIDMATLPKRCGFAYFVEATDVTKYNDQKTICKFQKAEMIYKGILGIFSEHVSNSTGIKSDDDSTTKIIALVSASGGVGSSTVAAACAKYFALKDKKVLYVNLEQFGSADMFFQGDGQFDFSDIIYAIKSKKTNLSLKLESNVKQDASGVYFFSSTKNALDLMELKPEDIKELFVTLTKMGVYDYIIADIDFSICETTIEILKTAKSILFVSDGSDISNAKFLRAFNSFNILDEQRDVSILGNLSIFYNKFSNKTGNMLELENSNVITVGGAPKYQNATSEQVIQELMTLDIFEKI